MSTSLSRPSRQIQLLQLLHRLSPAHPDNVHRLKSRSPIDVSRDEDGARQVRCGRRHVQPGRPSRGDAALRRTGHPLRRHGTRGEQIKAAKAQPNQTRILLQVHAISDADKVLKHFESYRSKFSALFPMPPLRKLDNPGYYKVCMHSRFPFLPRRRLGQRKSTLQACSLAK